MAVEGREYSLSLFDTIVIPGGIAHSAWNNSAAEPSEGTRCDRLARSSTGTNFHDVRAPPHAKRVCWALLGKNE